MEVIYKLEERIDSLKNDLFIKTAELNQMCKSNWDLNNKVDDLIRELTIQEFKWGKRVVEYQNAAAIKDMKIDELKDLLSDITEANNKLMGQVPFSHDDVVTMYQNVLYANREYRSKLNNEIRELKAEIDSITKYKCDLIKENDDIHLLVMKMEQELVEKNSVIDELQRENQNLHSSKSKTEEKLSKAEGTIASYQKTYDILRKENEELKSTNEKLEIERSNVINNSLTMAGNWSKLFSNSANKSQEAYDKVCKEKVELEESQRDLLMALTDLEIEYSELQNVTEIIDSDNERLTSIYQNLYNNYRELKHDNTNWSMLYKEALEINRITLETKNKLEKELATIKNNLK